MNKKTKMKLNKVINALPSFLGTMAAAAFSPLFLFFQNAGEAHFRDVAPIMLLFMAVGVVLFFGALFLMRHLAKAGVISILFLLIFLNYASIEGIIQMFLPSLRYWHIVPILVVLLLHIGWAIHKLLPVDLTEIITPVLAAVFAFLIVFNGITAAPAMMTRIRAEKEAERLAEKTVTADTVMPNFYFLLFDEFSSGLFMQRYFDYDNTPFVKELEDMGFSVSQTGHNYTASTAVVTTNLLNLDYVVRYEQTEEEKFAQRSNNVVFPMMRDAGYEVVAANGGSFYGIDDLVNSGENDAVTMSGETAHTLLMNMTVFYPRVTRFYPEVPQKIINALNFLKEPSNFEASNQFVVFHVDCPHPPFFFKEDGSLSENVTSKWTDPSGYLNQYIFTSNEMVQIADSIIKNDPDAIIWLLSDHAARASTDPEHEGFPNEDMTNYFSAVYFQGEKLDIEGLSGVNTFRVILNELLGTDFEMIPMPN